MGIYNFEKCKVYVPNCSAIPEFYILKLKNERHETWKFRNWNFEHWKFEHLHSLFDILGYLKFYQIL